MLAAASPLQEKAERSGKRGFGGSSPRHYDYRTKPFAGEAERSGKRGYYAAFNEALPVQQRFETLHKVCALAFAFSAAHICAAQLAVLHRAQCCTALGATQRPALHCAQRCTVRSILHFPDRSKRTKHIQVVEYFSQRSTAAALKRYASV